MNLGKTASLKSLLAKPFAKQIQKKVNNWANNPIKTQQKVLITYTSLQHY